MPTDTKSPQTPGEQTTALEKTAALDRTAALDQTEALVRQLRSLDVSTNPAETIRPASGESVVSAGRMARPLGYQRFPRAQGSWPPAGESGPGWQRPKPLPKRPTGRFFVGTMLTCMCSAMVWYVWTTFFSISAAGIVQGDTIGVLAPWDGRIAKVHCREGQAIAQGDLLLTVDSPELTRKLARLRDELAIERARLNADSLRLDREAHSDSAQYFQMWATLQKNREELLRMQGELEQITSVGEPGIISKQAYQRLVYAESGQRAFVETLNKSLEELRQRVGDLDAPPENGPPQLEPLLARINYLEGEISRTRDELREGEIRSPVSGIVARCQALPEQSVARHGPLLEIVDDASLKIELYVPQDTVHRYRPGAEIRVSVAPNATRLKCTVIGSRNRFEPAPHAIEHFYRDRDTLMPVILSPQYKERPAFLYMGAVARYEFIQRVNE